MAVAFQLVPSGLLQEGPKYGSGTTRSLALATPTCFLIP